MRRNSKRKLNIGKLLYIAAMSIVSIAISIVLFRISIQSTVALEQKLRCGIEEHTHTDSCYNGDFLECKKPAHTHDGNCYLVLLKDNDINTILTLLDQYGQRSLENAIQDVVSTALVFNNTMNTNENMVYSSNSVAELNETIADDETLPNLVLNENINNISTGTGEEVTVSNDVYVDEINASITSNDYYANFYVYLDRVWTCIGSLKFTSVKSGFTYTGTVETSQILSLVNEQLGTDFTYTSFKLQTAVGTNTVYTSTSLGETTTTLGSAQYNTSNAKKVKHVRLVSYSNPSTVTSFPFSSVRYVYPDGSTKLRYVQTGTSITLPTGNYEWDDGTKTYSAGEAVTIEKKTTFTAEDIGPVTHVNINYNMNFPTVSGVTVSIKPTLTGTTVTSVTDGYTEGTNAVVRNVSQHMVEGKVSGNSTGLSRVVQFKGWQLEGTNEILQPNTTLVWDELVYYENGGEITLTGIWESEAVRTASFFVRFDSVAVDTSGNITGQDANKYTRELFASYVGGVDPLLGYNTLHNKYHVADSTSDNSFGADQKIRALYGEKADGVWLGAFPSDDYIFSSLAEYAKTGYLSVDGEAVKVEDLSETEYAIRWYVFKCQDDAWHIDGKLVRKEGVIHVYKNFAGNKTLITKAKEGFYIDAYNQHDDEHTILNLNNYTTYESSTERYMWEITAVDYGEKWTITEHPTILNEPDVNFSTYSQYSVLDVESGHLITGSGNQVTVTGKTYALDEGIDEVLRAEFTNLYNRSNSILIKKQDSRTGAALGGASFQLLQNGSVLRFDYNSESGIYSLNNQNGAYNILGGNSDGYFEIAIEDFSYDIGPIVIREVTAPTGYTPIGDIEIGYTDDQHTIGMLSGNSELIRYTDGILVIGNSTESVTVTAKKTWECPETEWQEVTVQLLANGRLVTNIIAGVEPQVVLNSKNNWSYTWTNLPIYVNGAKIAWTLKEIQIGTEHCKTDGTFVNWLASYDLPVHSTGDNGVENILLGVTNTTKRVMLRLIKTDLGKTLQLSGATFLLEVVDEDGSVIATEVSKTATTGENGTLIFDHMKCGFRYRLTETVAPDGYLPLQDYIYFKIQEDGRVLVESNYFAEAGDAVYNLIVKNADALPLPESGGVGTSMLYAFGTLLMAIVAGIYINKRKKEYNK